MPPKLITFKEFLAEADELSEQAVARYGDFPLDFDILYTSKDGLDREWLPSGKFTVRGTTFIVIKSKRSNTYNVGLWVDDPDGTEIVFKRIAEIKLADKLLCGKTYSSVDLVRVNSEYRSSGIGTGLYEYLVSKLNVKLISDTEQYFGARKLWAKLSKKPTLTVDILDTRTCDIVHKDIKIEHGPLDWNVDDRIWSYENDDLIHLRMILKTIK